MLVYTNALFSAKRPMFVDVFPIEKEAHRKAQRTMFGAANSAGLSTKEADKPAMIAGINQLLGLRIESRKQLTVQEMEVITVAIDSGIFLPGWKVAPGFKATVKITVTVDISGRANDALPQDDTRFDGLSPF